MCSAMKERETREGWVRLVIANSLNSWAGCKTGVKRETETPHVHRNTHGVQLLCLCSSLIAPLHNSNELLQSIVGVNNSLTAAQVFYCLFSYLISTQSTLFTYIVAKWVSSV